MTDNEKNKSIFIERKQLTLGVKLTATFAITYYGLYFLFTTILGIFYRSVFDPSYLDNTVNDQSEMDAVLSFLILWATLGMIIFSLIALFMRKRYGKYLFMIFTIILIIHQIFNSSSSTVLPLMIESVIFITIIPLRVLKKIKIPQIYQKADEGENKRNNEDCTMKENETEENKKSITE